MMKDYTWKTPNSKTQSYVSKLCAMCLSFEFPILARPQSSTSANPLGRLLVQNIDRPV
jgi:hypothetical protein